MAAQVKKKKAAGAKLPKPKAGAAGKVAAKANSGSAGKGQANKAGKSSTKPSSVKSSSRSSEGSAKTKPSPKSAKGAKSKSIAPKSAAPKSAAPKTTGKSVAPKSSAASQREKELARVRAQKDKLKAQQEKDKLKVQQEKEKEKARLAQEKEKARLSAQRDKDKLKAQREQEKLDAQREKEEKKLEIQRAKDEVIAQKAEQKRLQAEEKANAIANAKAAREAEKVAAQRDKDAEKERLRLERLADKERAKLEREAEKERQRLERIAEKERIKRERDLERERQRQEREAAREAYRKAKEGEQLRLRAEREAAKKALEGRIARQSSRMRAAGSRLATTARVYSPSSIPDQSGTRVGGVTSHASKFANLRSVPPPPMEDPAREYRLPTLPPPPPESKPKTLEERYEVLLERLGKTDEEFRREYDQNYLMSWIYHDSALEGVVYTYDELRTGINPELTVVPDSSLQSVCDGIRRHKAAIDMVRELGEKKRQPVTLDMLKSIYITLHPEEGDLKTVKYRREIPQHRLYFHEYEAPDKIAPRVRQIFDWLNGPEPKKMKSAVKVAAKLHFDLLRVFPFEKDSGKATRLFVNLVLLRSDLPPAIIHLTERQRYYEALKSSLQTLTDMVQESMDNALLSVEKILDERDTRTRALV
ncbi:MAG TPA: Fic family protein [Polyangiaceae bacterium]|nr:Fic family protein [Polyangiaceae bacterium]